MVARVPDESRLQRVCAGRDGVAAVYPYAYVVSYLTSDATLPDVPNYRVAGPFLFIQAVRPRPTENYYTVAAAGLHTVVHHHKIAPPSLGAHAGRIRTSNARALTHKNTCRGPYVTFRCT